MSDKVTIDPKVIAEGRVLQIKNKIEDNSLQEMIQYYKNRDKDKIHLKGYMYDSLVYRYQIALWKAYMSDIEPMIDRLHISRSEAKAKVQDSYYRDLVRFCQILDEAIGERD